MKPSSQEKSFLKKIIVGKVQLRFKQEWFRTHNTFLEHLCQLVYLSCSGKPVPVYLSTSCCLSVFFLLIVCMFYNFLSLISLLFLANISFLFVCLPNPINFSILFIYENMILLGHGKKTKQWGLSHFHSRISSITGSSPAGHLPKITHQKLL